MTAVTTLPFKPDGWTVDDLDELPDDGYRYELVDGSLLVSPPPEFDHQYLASRLIVLLSPQLPEPLRAVGAPGVYFDRRNYRVPDLVVVPRGETLRRRVGPSDVVVAVELVSPGSRSTDRVAKPAQYAAAGIAHYWRLELDPLELVVHDLAGDTYREAGRYDDEVELVHPLPVRLRLADLLG